MGTYISAHAYDLKNSRVRSHSSRSELSSRKNLNRSHDRKYEILVAKVDRHLTLVPLEKIDQTQYFKKRFLPLESTPSGLPNQLSTET